MSNQIMQNDSTYFLLYIKQYNKRSVCERGVTLILAKIPIDRM